MQIKSPIQQEQKSVFIGGMSKALQQATNIDESQSEHRLDQSSVSVSKKRVTMINFSRQKL